MEQTQQNVGEKLTNTGTEITRGLEQRVGELDTNLRNAGEGLIADFVERLDEAGLRIAATLSDGGGRITETLGEASTRLSATWAGTFGTLSSQSDQMNERLSLNARRNLERARQSYRYDARDRWDGRTADARHLHLSRERSQRAVFPRRWARPSPRLPRMAIG